MDEIDSGLAAEMRYYDLDGDDDWAGVSNDPPNPIREKSYRFALDIIDLYKRIVGTREFVISKQLLRSGTSVGANVEEAIAAESRKDFIHKMAVASKEARETVYWLRLLADSGLVPELDVSAELRTADDLVRMLTSIVKTSRRTK